MDTKRKSRVSVVTDKHISAQVINMYHVCYVA